MHDVRARADGDEARERAVVHEARVVPAGDEGGDRPARHREQRVDGDEPGDLVEGLRAHHVEPEPADRQHPRAEGEERNRRRRVRRYPALLRVAAAPRAEHQHGDEADPAAHRVDDDAPGEVVELRAERALEPRLDAVVLVPGDAFEERIDEADEQERRGELRIEPRTLGDAAGDDRRDRRGEREQEEELDELEAALLRERLGAGEEVDAVGDRVADEEVRDRGDGEVDDDLHQRVHLVLLAHGAELEEGEAGVHREHHDRAQQDEQGVAACLQGFHGASQALGRIRRVDGRRAPGWRTADSAVAGARAARRHDSPRPDRRGMTSRYST